MVKTCDFMLRDWSLKVQHGVGKAAQVSIKSFSMGSESLNSGRCSAILHEPQFQLFHLQNGGNMIVVRIKYVKATGTQ